VVRHQAVGEQIDRLAGGRLGRDPFDGFAVAVLVEQGHVTGPTVADVVGHARLNLSIRPWHASNLRSWGRIVKRPKSGQRAHGRHPGRTHENSSVCPDRRRADWPHVCRVHRAHRAVTTSFAR